MIREREVRFPSASGEASFRGVAHEGIDGLSRAALVIAHGRSGDHRDRLLRRLSAEAAESGVWALRFDFRYVDAKGKASRDLSREEDDLRGAVRFARSAVPAGPVVIAGKSMGARVCFRASSDPEVAGVIALGYPLHPRNRPEVRDPPEWPLLAKPVLFVQGDHDPFCDLARLEEERSRLAVPSELVVVRNAGHSFEPIGGKRDAFPDVWEAVRQTLSRTQAVR
jgi:hypothetical protein